MSRRETLRDDKRSETSKYKPPRRNSQTESHALRIFERRSERELMQFLGENGLNEDSPRFAELSASAAKNCGSQLVQFLAGFVSLDRRESGKVLFQ